MKKAIISIFVILLCLKINADISPDPVKAKGISTNGITDIKMTYEKVVIDLTLDSSFVHCYFRLRNDGKARSIQIGYPNMIFSPWMTQQKLSFNPFTVFENGNRINQISFFTPDSLNLYNNDDNHKPWYLWNSHFELNETKVVDVSYSLPRGMVKNDLYSTFEYLLSTGAGWKGNIDTAEVVVNLKNFDKGLILKTLPGGFVASNNQIVWKFYNFEPTLKDNISIKYEMKKGKYEANLKFSINHVIMLDNNLLSNDIRLDKSIGSIDDLNPYDIASIDIIKTSEEAKLRFPNINCPNGLILFYSKRFAIDNLLNVIKSKSSYLVNDLQFLSISDLEKNYSLVLNNKIIKSNEMMGEFLKLNIESVKSVSIRNLESKRKEIDILLN